MLVTPYLSEENEFLVFLPHFTMKTEDREEGGNH